MSSVAAFNHKDDCMDLFSKHFLPYAYLSREKLSLSLDLRDDNSSEQPLPLQTVYRNIRHGCSMALLLILLYEPKVGMVVDCVLT